MATRSAQDVANSFVSNLASWRDEIVASISTPVVTYKVPLGIREKLAGFTGDVFSHDMLWFEKGVADKSGVPGYTSSDPNTVKLQLDLKQLLGINGSLFDWRGPWNARETKAFQENLKQMGLRGMKAGIVIDKDAALKGPHKIGTAPDVNANFIDAANYVIANWQSQPGFYSKYILAFGVIDKGLDINKVQAALPNIKFLHSGNNSGPVGYSWTNNDLAATYSKNKATIKIGSAYYKFADWNPADPGHQIWDSTKAARFKNPYEVPNVWDYCFKQFLDALALGVPLEAIQLVTWNDYTERTQLEAIAQLSTGMRII